MLLILTSCGFSLSLKAPALEVFISEDITLHLTPRDHVFNVESTHAQAEVRVQRTHHKSGKFERTRRLLLYMYILIIHVYTYTQKNPTSF